MSWPSSIQVGGASWFATNGRSHTLHFPHEAECLRTLLELMPGRTPFRYWKDLHDRGTSSEIDLLFLAPGPACSSDEHGSGTLLPAA